MSWDINLICHCCKRNLEVPGHSEGATINMFEDSTTASMNVTYNYSKFFDFDSLNGKKAKSTIRLLTKTVKELGVIRSENYWEKTSGNVGHTCKILLSWAKLHPKGIWEVM